MMVIGVAPVQPTRNTLYFPIASNTNSVRSCFDSDEAYTMFLLIKNDSRQKRRKLVCHPKLIEVAKKRSEELTVTWGHTNADGVTPNEQIVNSGLILPPYYSVVGNNVESIGGGTVDVVVMFNALAQSLSHSIHLFGIGDFFESQIYCGIALAYGGHYNYYWSIIITDLVTSGE